MALLGCVKEEPVPPEVQFAREQELNLWRAGAHLYLQSSFTQYQEAFARAKDTLVQANSRFVWFRDYKPVKAEFSRLLVQGEGLLKDLETEKQKRAQDLKERMKTLGETLYQIDAATRMMNESGASRSFLTKAEVVLKEARGLSAAGQYLAAEKKLGETEKYLTEAEKVIKPILTRYRDENQINKWRRWAREAVEESKRKGIHSILVIKESKKLFLYKNGEVVKTYPIGLGRNGWSDKLRAKDNATPEGIYRISGKNPKSKYHRALLINYPNDEDRRDFSRAKKKGLLPAAARIGGSIEIHGGGNEGVTYGCVALDDRQMEELYRLAEVGTPVAIVGALDSLNNLSSISAAIGRGRTKKEMD